MKESSVVLFENPRQGALDHSDTATMLQLRGADTACKTYASKELSARAFTIYTKLNGKGIWYKSRKSDTFTSIDYLQEIQYRTNVSPRIMEKKHGFRVMHDFQDGNVMDFSYSSLKNEANGAMRFYGKNTIPYYCPSTAPESHNALAAFPFFPHYSEEIDLITVVHIQFVPKTMSYKCTITKGGGEIVYDCPAPPFEKLEGIPKEKLITARSSQKKLFALGNVDINSIVVLDVDALQWKAVQSSFVLHKLQNGYRLLSMYYNIDERLCVSLVKEEAVKVYCEKDKQAGWLFEENVKGDFYPIAQMKESSILETEN